MCGSFMGTWDLQDQSLGLLEHLIFFPDTWNAVSKSLGLRLYMKSRFLWVIFPFQAIVVSYEP